MGIAPSEFWSLGWREFIAASQGFRDFHSGGKDKAEPPTREEADEIIKSARATLKKQGIEPWQ